MKFTLSYRRFATGYLPVFYAFVAVCLLAVGLAGNVAGQGTKAEYDRAANFTKMTAGKVFRDRVTPHWAANGDLFWYCNQLDGGEKEYVLVDVATGVRKLAFDHTRFAESLNNCCDANEGEHAKFDAKRLAIEEIIPVEDETDILYVKLSGKWWSLDTKEYMVEGVDKAEIDQLISDDASPEQPLRQNSRRGRDNRSDGTGGDRPGNVSPDGCYRAEIRDNNIVIRILKADDYSGNNTEQDVVDSEQSSDSESDDADTKENVENSSGDDKMQGEQENNSLQLEFSLTDNGTDEDPYINEFYWSPDSNYLISIRRAKPQEHKVYLIESSPRDQVQPKLHSHDYLKPGDKIAHPRPRLFDIKSRKMIELNESLFENPWSIQRYHWSPDSKRFYFLYNERGHQTLRIVGVDSASGETHAIIDDQSDTFINYAYYEYTRYLDESNEIIWMSERDGWNGLYLFDSITGKLKNRITCGDYVVLGIDRVDAEKRHIWFHACGIVPGQDPYYVHFCRIDFDGSNLVMLTEGDGTHEIDYSPDGRYYLDRYSRVDMAPVTELCRSEDGKLLCTLEHGDMSQLLKTGWRPPERFVSKGRDGKTDIYGVIWRPTNFDPNRKYPVIEYIYAGPHGFFTPKSFSVYKRVVHSVVELGFIVVQLDGMGTSHRSKAFHDVCWQNLKDSGFPDRIPWIKAAAEKYPEMDLSRVGIYGGSAGGQSSLRGMLDYGDFYKVCVSDCGCHDNRMDKIWWNEAWLGVPEGDVYKRNSNVEDAHKLKGKLLLVVGEMDHNVDPSSTMQVVDALIRADKDFDMLVIPGADHGAAETPYGSRRRQDFFVRNLLGVEPRK